MSTIFITAKEFELIREAVQQAACRGLGPDAPTLKAVCHKFRKLDPRRGLKVTSDTEAQP